MNFQNIAIKNITSYTFLLAFKIVKNLQCIFKTSSPKKISYRVVYNSKTMSHLYEAARKYFLNFFVDLFRKFSVTFTTATQTIYHPK